jgi:UDP-N-acetyl-D-galactosamine dehydrogenase
LILSGRRFNENMGRYIAIQTALLISQQKISITKARIAILGFSFKENIPDTRNTKVIQIINELKKWNAKVEVFDSIVSQDEVKKEYGIKIKKFNDFKNKKFDAIILAVSHKEFIKKVSFYNSYFKNKNKKIIIDVKNNFTQSELKKNKYYFFQL